MPERNASDWNTLRVLSLKVVMPERDSEYEIPTRATPERRNSFRSAVPLETVSPVDDWL